MGQTVLGNQESSVRKHGFRLLGLSVFWRVSGWTRSFVGSEVRLHRRSGFESQAFRHMVKLELTNEETQWLYRWINSFQMDEFELNSIEMKLEEQMERNGPQLKKWWRQQKKLDPQ